MYKLRGSFKSLFNKEKGPKAAGKEFLGLRITEDLLERLDMWVESPKTPYEDRSSLIRDLMLQKFSKWSSRYRKEAKEGKEEERGIE